MKCLIKGLKFSLAHYSWSWYDECIAVYGKFLNIYSKTHSLSAEMFVTEPGYVLWAVNLPFKEEPVAGRVSEALGVSVFLDNDANCALIGEHAAGAGKCGLRGCFEQHASATALIAMTRRCVRAFPESLLAEAAAQGIDGSTAFWAAKHGCPAAEELLRDYGEILALGVNSLVKLFQPQVTVLSGGMAMQGRYLLGFIEPYLISDAVVRTTTLGGNGGLIGAAMLGYVT